MGYVLILGADSDIAKAIAIKYAKNGYGVYLAGKDTVKLEKEAVQIETQYKAKVKVFRFDALEFYNHKNFYNSLEPKPAGVICAIDYLGDQYESEEDFLETKKIIDMNFTGCVSILNIIANDFEARREGFIVSITSTAGDRGRRSNYTYGSAKAGLTNYLSGLRSRLIEADVQVTTVKTGAIFNKATNDELFYIAPAKPHEIADDVFKK